MTLYHYCSVEAFLGIVCNKEIWLSDLKQTNDELELKSGEEKIIEVWKSVFKEEPQPYYQDSQNRNYKSAFAFCLSEKPDALSQWRGYADDGRGVSIGFDLKLLGIEKNYPTNLPLSKYCIGYEKVVYEEEEFLIGKLKEVEKTFSTITGTKKDFMKWGVYTNIGKFKFFYKNKGFAEEEEYRVVYIDPSYASSAKMLKKGDPFYQEYPDNVMPEGPFFRHSHGRIICYYKYHFKDTKENCPIKKIYLGPACKVDKEYIRFFLEKNDYKPRKRIVIQESKASYRPHNS